MEGAAHHDDELLDSYGAMAGFVVCVIKYN